MDPERQRRKEEIEKALGFIQYVILPFLSLPFTCMSWLFNDDVLWLYRSSLPFPDPEGYEVCVILFHAVMYTCWQHVELFWVIILSTLQTFLTQLVCNLLDEGNTVFRDGDWRQAAVHYSEGVNVARYAQSEALVIPQELLESLYVNRAAAHYSLVSACIMFLPPSGVEY